MSTLSVVEQILREAAVPMSVKEIVQRAGAELPTKSKTPDTVVARDLSMDIKKKGEASLFVRTSPGRYAMRDQQLDQQLDQQSDQQRAQPQQPQANDGGNENGATPLSERAVADGRAPTKAAVLPGDALDQGDTASA